MLKRRRQKKTNYKKRIGLLKSRMPRLVVRCHENSFIVQIIEYKIDGDVTLAHFSSKSLKSNGWKFGSKNTPAAYLTGFATGCIAASKGIKNAIVDFGLNRKIPKTKIYAAVKGAIDSGIDINVGEGCFPSEERINGSFIADYYEKVKSSDSNNQFSKSEDINGISNAFNDVKIKLKTVKVKFNDA